jgi:hypothetical protein
MNYTFKPNSAKEIKIVIIAFDGLTKLAEAFLSFLKKYILGAIKIYQSFNLHVQTIINSYQCEEYNLIFLVIPYTEMEKFVLSGDISKVTSCITYPRNHLFIIIDECHDLVVDDNDELFFVDDNKNIKYQDFIKILDCKNNENLFNVCKMNTNMAIIWKTIIDDNSIMNLTEEQINILFQITNKKMSKMTPTDIKKELRAMLRKMDITSKLAETGYNKLFSIVSQYLKITHQKKMVCQNYLYYFEKIDIGVNMTEINNITTLLKEIYGITFIKSDVYDELVDRIENLLMSKLKHFYHKCKNNISIGSEKSNYIDAYIYHRFLCEIMEIAKGYNLSNITDITKKEMKIVNSLIINYHEQEMEKITDLDKIASHLEIFADKDRNTLINLFEKIRMQQKVIQENVENMKKWVLFFDKCTKIGIPKELMLQLIEEIIMYKIQYYSDTSRISPKNPSIIYPQCLHIFLLVNIDKHFVFKKLYMFTSYSIRYSGRNIGDYIKNLTQDQYHTLLILENKLLEICSENLEEPSQTINLKNINIVETFNDAKKCIEKH